VSDDLASALGHEGQSEPRVRRPQGVEELTHALAPERLGHDVADGRLLTGSFGAQVHRFSHAT